MNKSKILTVVLTIVISIILGLVYITVTKTLMSTANISPVIMVKSADTDTNITEVGSTNATNEDNNEKITVTSRSGKHEALPENTEIVVSEEPITEEETPAPAPVEEVVVETEAETVEEVVEEEKPTFEGVELEYSAPYNITSARLSKSKGVTYYNGHKETYYSQRVLPGKGLKSLNNNGRHVADDGTVRDGDGYIAVACNYLSKGSEIMTSLGPGKVYDTGSMTGKWIDIYVNW